MTPYFLLRHNKQSGPYSLEQLKSLDLRPTDLIWKEGVHKAWRNPEELDELLPFLQQIAESKEVLNLSPQPNQSIEKYLSENDIIVELQEGKKETVPQDNLQAQLDEQPTITISEPVIAGSQSAQPADPIKVIIADDHTLFRQGVKLALAHKTDIEVIAEAETGVHLLNLLKHHKPDVILLDIEMPIMDGITALKEIRTFYGNLKVIILSMHEARSMVTTLMKTGANSYLSKSADSTTIYKAIRGVHSNDFHYTDLSNKSLIESLKETPKNAVKERPATPIRDNSDMMLKLRDINRNAMRVPSRKRKKKSILLLIASVFTGIAIFGMFNFIEPAPKNRVLYSAPIPDSTQMAEPIAPSQTAEKENSQIINDLLREQDSILQGRRFKDDSEPIDSVLTIPTTKPRKRISVKPEEKTIETEQIAPTEVEKQELVVTSPTVDSPVVKDNGLERYQLRNQLSVTANNYNKGIFGGVSDIELTVKNGSSHFVNDVTIQLDYLLTGKKVHRSTVLHAADIPAGSSKVIAAPRNSRGISIQYWITGWSSKELE